MVTCNICKEIFGTRQALSKHKQISHIEHEQSARCFKCGECESVFTFSHNLIRHLRTQHQCNRHLRCKSCPTYFGSESRLSSHMTDQHSIHNPSPQVSRATSDNDIGSLELFRERASIKRFFRTHRWDLSKHCILDPFEFLVDHMTNICDKVNSEIETMVTAKLGFSIQVSFEKPLTQDKASSYFNSAMQPISTILSEDEFYKHVDQLMTQVNIFCTAGSGWVIERLVSLDVKMNKYNPTRIGSFIPTPQPLEKLRQSLLNVKNTNDNNCFLYCIAAALYPVKRNAEHPAQYRKHFKRFVFDPKSMPMPLSKIPRFETANNLSILVYAYENSQIYPIYITKNTEATKLIHFMTITDEEKSHYSLKKTWTAGKA